MADREAERADPVAVRVADTAADPADRAERAQRCADRRAVCHLTCHDLVSGT
ncbi:hypothetical protein [Streptomyces sp. NPDC007100]|uniref:hypothetical protein n=1 Tax=Streptomyces sp. NPDC007100 TaxID=3155602 RepID=UPI0033E38402